MNNMSLYLKNKVINESLENAHVALLSDNIEITKDNYERQPAIFVKSTTGQTSNVDNIPFPVAGTKWGDITHVAIYDRATGGNELWKAEAEFVQNIDVSGQYRIPGNHLIVRIR